MASAGVRFGAGIDIDLVLTHREGGSLDIAHARGKNEGDSRVKYEA